eukprot:COSAG01_NODE_6947_length_3426_cov_13.114217_3_plen_133_part_00
MWRLLLSRNIETQRPRPPGPVPPPAPAPTQMAALQLLFVLLMKRRAPVFAETQPLMDAAAETRLHSRILRSGAAVLQTAMHGETAGTGRAAEEGCRLRVRAVQLLGAVVAVRREIATNLLAAARLSGRHSDD